MNSFLFLVLSSTLATLTSSQRFLGSLNTLWHRVAGDVYALDEGTIFIHNFDYDAQVINATDHAAMNSSETILAL